MVATIAAIGVFLMCVVAYIWGYQDGKADKDKGKF